MQLQCCRLRRTSAGHDAQLTELHVIDPSCRLQKRDRCLEVAFIKLCKVMASSTGSTAGATPGPDVMDKIEPIRIYVDNSNLFISAKAAWAAEHMPWLTQEDHRIRFDIGRLAKVLANGRKIEYSCVYGSKPPDTVWKKMEKSGWICKIHERSKYSGREKQVDASMNVDITAAACDGADKPPGTIVVVSGDSDFIPGIKLALKKKWKVEVYSCKHSMSSDIDRLKKDHDAEGDLQVEHLDQHLEYITFYNRKFDPKKGIPDTLHTKFVVCHMEADQSVDHKRFPNDKWCLKVDEISQWPFLYYWHEDVLDDLVLVFCADGSNIFNADSFVEKVNSDHPFNGVKNVEIYTAVSKPTGASNSKAAKGSTRCTSKIYCWHGFKCRFEHTSEEKEYFKGNGGKGKSCRKTAPCKKECKFKNDTIKCDFAHGEEDAFCRNCSKNGHFQQNCPSPIS